jgi:DNA polymerase-3 subunit gamma/tau
VPGGQPPGGPAAAPRGPVTLQSLQRAWPNVIEAIKAKGRVASMVIGNASVDGFDEGVLTLRFPRQGDVRGFQGTKYEDLLKQALNAMFGINVAIRAITGSGGGPAGGDGQGGGRRPGPVPSAPPGPASPAVPGGAPQPFGQYPPASHGSAGPGQAGPGQAGTTWQAGPGQPGSGQPVPGNTAPVQQPGPTASPGTGDYPPQPGIDLAAKAGPAGSVTGNAGGGDTHPFTQAGFAAAGFGGDLPPLPPQPPDDDDFDPDDEDMSASSTVHELTGMTLVQRELGAQIIAEYDD